MRLKIPITGRVLDYDPVAGQIDGIGVIGDNNDPVKIVNISLGNISWRLVTIDLENDLAEIEVSPAEDISEPELDTKSKPIIDAKGNPVIKSRPATEEEKQGFLNNARNLVESHTVDELYSMSKSKRLIKPTEALRKYREKPPNVATREQLLSQG